jgi:molybdopterin-guanine dinucleotide biosynthesis protein A
VSALDAAVKPNSTIHLPGMLLIGSAERNAGKTEFSCRTIKEFLGDREFIAVKITAIDRADGQCPRGGEGCGVCSSLKGPFEISEETDSKRHKDTCRLLAAGATKVFWLRVLKAHMREGLQAVLDTIGKDSVWLCESNSIRNVVRPGVFLMVQDSQSSNYKASAKKVRGFVDRMVTTLRESESFDFDFKRLSIEGSQWSLKEDAAVIILAGGKSSRMGSNKSLLPVGDCSMIERIVSQVRGHFDETIISAANAEEYAFLNLPVAVDAEAGCGPLMGISAALARSTHDLNFVTTCDVPDIEMPFVRNMLRIAETADADIVVPRHPDGKIEPLQAVYRKRLEIKIADLLKAGERRVRSVFDGCKVEYYDLPERSTIVNLNTKEEYEDYCESKPEQ